MTFANIVAVTALAVSLSGGAYAAAKINGKDIKRGSIAGKALKRDTVTGRQVDEASLGTVPNAGTAATLGGVGPGGFTRSGDTKRFTVERTVTSPSTTIPVLRLGSFTAEITCSVSGSSLLQGRSSVGGSFDLASTSSASDSPTLKDQLTGGALSATLTTMTSGASVPVGGFTRQVGSFVYNSNPAAETISVTFVVFTSRSGNDAAFCYVAGTALRTTG